MSPASTFTDHSVAAILAPERQQLAAWNLSPYVDARRQQDDVCVTEETCESLCARREVSRFAGRDDHVLMTGGAADSARHQINVRSFSTSVDPMTSVCSPSGSRLVSHFDQPRQEDSDEAMITAQPPVLRNIELKAVGFVPTHASVEDDDRGGQWTAGPHRGGVLCPAPTFPHRSPSYAVTDSAQLELESADLWTRFDRLTTEMVITKSGRSVTV